MTPRKTYEAMQDRIDAERGWLGRRLTYKRGEWLVWISLFIVGGVIVGYGLGSL